MEEKETNSYNQKRWVGVNHHKTDYVTFWNPATLAQSAIS